MKMKNTLLAMFAILLSFASVNAEYAVFDNKADFEKSKWSVCKMATDGCNSYFVVDGKIWGGTRMMCEENFKPEWTCKTLKDNIWTTMSLPGSDKDSHGCIGSAGYSWNQAENKCTRSFENKWNGSDKDNHGCIGSAGYVWSISKNKCIRPFEEGVLSNNDKNFYDVIKKRLNSKDTATAKNVLVKYEKILKKYSSNKKQTVHEKAVSQLENMITEFLLQYPADAALPEKANNYYLMLTLIKFEMMQLSY